MLLAIFGITDSSLNLVVSLLFLFLVVAWLALVWWTYQDARGRTNDSVLVGSAVAAALIFPFAGALLYSIVRPPELLSDVEERGLEVQALRLRVRHLTESSCPRCQYPLERMFLRCPECHTRVKDPCPNCSKPVDRRWSLCPYCETRLVRRGEAEARPAQREPRPAPTAQPRRRAAQAAGRPADDARPPGEPGQAKARPEPRRAARKQSPTD
jgi:hypothetical protein